MGGGQHARAEPGPLGGPDPRERLAVVPEEDRDHLDSLDRHPQVRRRLGGRGAGQRAALGRVAGEQQRLRKGERRGRPRLRVGESVVGHPQVLARGRRVHLRGGDPELEVQLAAQLRRRRLLERALEVGQRAVRPAAPAGLAGRRAQQPDGGAVAAARRVQELGGDLLRRRAGTGEHVGGAPVQELALAGRHVDVHDVAHERVDVAERRLGPQDVRPRQLSRGAGDGRLVEAGQRGDDRQPRAVAEHGHGARDRNGVGRQPRQPQQDGARHRAGPDLAHRRRTGRARGDTVVLERGQQVTEEQRVAARRLAARRGEARIRVAEPRRHELGHRGLAERRRPHGLAQRVAGDLRDQRRVGPRLGGAQGRRHQHRRTLQPAHQVGHEAQRRPVAPLQVVEREQHGALLDQIQHRPVEAVQHGERALRGAAGEHALGRRRGPRQHALALGHRLEQLPHRAEGEVALELTAAGGQDRHPPCRALAQLAQQATLADPRRPLDEGDPAAAVLGLAEQPVERRQLPVALEQAVHASRIVRSAPSTITIHRLRTQNPPSR
jgi:hypothetical protein